MYSEDRLIQLQNSHEDLCEKLNSLNGRLVAYLAPKLLVSHAKEYLLHGVCRRLGLINKTIKNIYTIFPPNRTEKLSFDEIENTQINLHAFLINVYGVLDNLAWVYALENQLDDLLEKPVCIGLYRKEFQRNLPDFFREYLMSERIKNWVDKYAKNYRDALAHRIPAYIPPFSLNPEEVSQYQKLDSKIHEAVMNHEFELLDELNSEQEKLGSISYTYLHSFYHDKSQPVNLHHQILEDGFFVVDIADKFSKVL
jgi:hypothetical protein